MANNKVYDNYLMHGRTKGSRNGISTTKGYRAVGHKARGRLGPDGRYIYDMSTHKKYVANGLGAPGMGSYIRYELNTKNAKKNGIDVNFAQKTINALNKGADNPWQQKANAAQYKDLYKDAIRSDTSRNDWQQQAKRSEFNTRNVNVYDPTTDTYTETDRNKVKEYNKALIKKLEGTLPNTLGGATNQSSTTGTVTKPKTPGINTATDPRFNPIGSSKIDHAKGVAWDKKHLRELQAEVAKERAKEIHDSNIAGQNMAYENSKKAANRKATEAAKKSAEQGAKNNWQQQAAYAQKKAEAKARWNAGNKAQAAKKSAEQSAKQGAKNNWQQQANAKRDDVETMRKYNRDEISGITGKASNGDTVKISKPKAGKTEVSIVSKGAMSKGKENNWQQKAAREAAGTDTKNRALGGSSKAVYMPRKVGGDAYVNPSNFEIDTERKPNKTAGANAMRNDPRYNLYESQKIEQAAVTRAKKSLNRNKKPVTSSKSNVSKIEKAITDALKKKKKKK